MFTGLIETVGRVERLDPAGAGDAGSCALRVAASLGPELTAGESIAVNGVCLTVVSADAGGFEAVVSPQTLRVTALGRLEAGRAVNLERSMRVDGRLGGHFVLGHVDGVGRLARVRDDGESRWLEVELPEPLRALVVDKGSIALDGISLTVAALTDAGVGIQVVPFTLSHTTLGESRPGDTMNIETDIIGKHVARLLGARAPLVPAGE